MENLEMDPGQYQHYLSEVSKLLSEYDDVKKQNITTAITKALKEDFTNVFTGERKSGYEDVRAKLIVDLEKKFLTKTEQPKTMLKDLPGMMRGAASMEKRQKGILGKDYE